MLQLHVIIGNVCFIGKCLFIITIFSISWPYWLIRFIIQLFVTRKKKKNFIGNFTCRFYYNNSTQKLRLSMMVCIYISISKPQMDRNFIFNKLILALFLNMNWIQFNSPFYIQLFLFKINLFSLYLANIFMVQSISLSNQILN